MALLEGYQRGKMRESGRKIKLKKKRKEGETKKEMTGGWCRVLLWSLQKDK